LKRSIHFLEAVEIYVYIEAVSFDRGFLKIYKLCLTSPLCVLTEDKRKGEGVGGELRGKEGLQAIIMHCI
jgi:hypothetical protein